MSIAKTSAIRIPTSSFFRVGPDHSPDHTADDHPERTTEKRFGNTEKITVKFRRNRNDRTE